MATHQARQILERIIADRLVRTILDAGFSIDVYDGEEFALNKSTDPAEILKSLFSTDEDYIYVNTQACSCDPVASCPNAPGTHLGIATHCRRRAGIEHRRFGWIRLIYGNSGYDVIAENTPNLEPLLKPITDLCNQLQLDPLAAIDTVLQVTPISPVANDFIGKIARMKTDDEFIDGMCGDDAAGTLSVLIREARGFAPTAAIALTVEQRKAARWDYLRRRHNDLEDFLCVMVDDGMIEDAAELPTPANGIPIPDLNAAVDVLMKNDGVTLPEVDHAKAAAMTFVAKVASLKNSAESDDTGLDAGDIVVMIDQLIEEARAVPSQAARTPGVESLAATLLPITTERAATIKGLWDALSEIIEEPESRISDENREAARVAIKEAARVGLILE